MNIRNRLGRLSAITYIPGFCQWGRVVTAGHESLLTLLPEIGESGFGVS
ncbi:MAG: hypothetical protein J0H48_01070 [Nitrosospira multiformis]|nr:hypothetical protein [Nitrosospira multiformis]